MMLASLGLPEHKMRVIAPEVGGGFGSKIHHYADEAIAPFCSMQLGRPVKWTATRSETNLTDAHGRDHVTRRRDRARRRRTGSSACASTPTPASAPTSRPSRPAVPTYLYGTLLSGPVRHPGASTAT